jgi:hypothetical protein
MAAHGDLGARSTTTTQSPAWQHCTNGHNPSAGQNFEALRRVGTFDDFYRPFADALQSLA